MSDQRPDRAELVNLTDRSFLPFLINPQTIEERLEVNYKRQPPIGLSHERLQYKNTGNTTYPIELYMDQHMIDRFMPDPINQPDVLQRKNWLKSLCYPVSDQDYSRIGPTRVLFNWPNTFRVVGRITGQVTFLHREFNYQNLKTRVLVANFTIEEDLDSRVLMNDVVINGSLSIGVRL